MKYRLGIVRLLLIGGGIGLLSSVTAHAQEDLDVTMRMVADDEALSGSFVQELQLPEPEMVPGSAAPDPDDPGLEIARDARESGRSMGETLAEQARESRNALDMELPGEMVVRPDEAPARPELPESPETPGLEPPELDLPGVDAPDLPLVEEGPLLDETGGLLDAR